MSPIRVSLIMVKKISKGNKIIIDTFLFMISTTISFVPSVFATLILNIRFPILAFLNTQSFQNMPAGWYQAHLRRIPNISLVLRIVRIEDRLQSLRCQIASRLYPARNQIIGRPMLLGFRLLLCYTVD